MLSLELNKGATGEQRQTNKAHIKEAGVQLTKVAFSLSIILNIFALLGFWGCSAIDKRESNSPPESVEAKEGQAGNEFAEKEVYEIEPEQLYDLIKKGTALRLIDVRDPEEVTDMPFKGAQNIPLGTLEERVKELNPEEEVVLICRSGRRSSLAAKFLIQAGFENIKHLKGGINAWMQQIEPNLKQ